MSGITRQWRNFALMTFAAAEVDSGRHIFWELQLNPRSRWHELLRCGRLDDVVPGHRMEEVKGHPSMS